jgi:hypothetical protein
MKLLHLKSRDKTGWPPLFSYDQRKRLVNRVLCKVLAIHIELVWNVEYRASVPKEH